jgi:signal transduction histidine kinase
VEGQVQRPLEPVRPLRESDPGITSPLDLRATLDALSKKYEKADLSRRELELTNLNLKKSLRLLSGLYAALTPLTPSEPIGEIIDGIIERLVEATGADAALIRVWKRETGAYIVAGHRGFPDDYVKQVETVLLGGAADWVVEHGEPIIAPDIASEPRFTTNVQVQLGFRSCATLPLKIHNYVRGIIHLSSRKSGYFDEEQKDHLVAIAQQMGVALENRELFDNLKASRDQLEKASKVKDEFLSVMSHELRTPLSVVMGYAGMIKEKLLGEINPQQEQALQKLLTRATDQLNMINAVMQATQLEAGALALERQLVNLSDLLTRLNQEYESTHDKEQVALIWDYPSEPVPIVSDSGKLRQILLSLISNAVKFTDQGSVAVSMRLTERRGKKWVELKVADTGVGMAEEQISGIFDKFFQVDSSQTRLYGGVGLGLYIVKKFTELLGGIVGVESQPDKGSTFTVTIPVEQ